MVPEVKIEILGVVDRKDIELSSNEKKILETLHRWQFLKQDIPPLSIRNIQELAGFSSTDTVHKGLKRLEEKGLVSNSDSHSRTWHLEKNITFIFRLDSEWQITNNESSS